MESVLAGISHVISYLDDILISGVNELEHRANLAKVFTRLENCRILTQGEEMSFQQNFSHILGSSH